MGAGCVGSEPRAARLGKGVRGGGEGILGLGTADSSPGMNVEFKALRWFSLGGQGTFPKGCRYTCERAAQLYLPEATSGCPSSARAGAPVGAKEVCSVSVVPYPSEEHTPQDASKHLKDVQLTTQLC